MAKDTTRTEAAELDLEENARLLKEARERLEAEAEKTERKFVKTARFIADNELAIVERLAAAEGKTFPVKTADGRSDFETNDRLLKEARRIYESNMTRQDVAHEQAMINELVESLNNRCAGAYNWLNFLESRELWQMLQDETQKNMIFSSYRHYAGEINFYLIQLEGLLSRYEIRRTTLEKDLARFYQSGQALFNGIYLLPFIIAEYAKPIYGGKCPAELYEEAEKDENGQPLKNSLYSQAAAAAIAEYNKSLEPKENIEKFTAAPVTSFLTPLDKINNAVWTKPTVGSFVTEFAIATKGKGKDKKELKVTYSADFRALDNATSRKLSAFDKRVVFAVAACMDAGNEIISYSQLYRAMGGKSSISASQISAIDKSLNLLAATRVIYTLAEEKGFSYKGINIDAACIEFERIKKVDINGAIAEGAIRPLRYPPAVTFAKEINQITTNDIKLLQDIPLNITQETCAITDYILAHIAMMNNKGGDISSFLLETICKETGVSNPRQKLRAIDKITKVLESCKKYKKIKSFSYDKDKKKFIITY